MASISGQIPASASGVFPACFSGIFGSPAHLPFRGNHRLNVFGASFSFSLVPLLFSHLAFLLHLLTYFFCSF